MRTWTRTARVGAPAPAPPAVPQQPASTGAKRTAQAHLPPHTHLLRLLPTPKGTPFTFYYGLILIATTVLTEFADPEAVARWRAGSSTDVSNLAQEPLFVLVASALFYAGSLLSPYAIGFFLGLTALERRIGGWRTAAVFVAGHVLATLATQLTVAAAVALDHLPESSLTRFDYGISYGVLACAAALAGVLRTVWLRWVMIGGIGALVISELVSLNDPLTSWGRFLAFLVGIAMWPLLRRYQERGSAAQRS